MERLKCNFGGKPHLNAVKYYHIYEQLIEIHHLDVSAVQGATFCRGGLRNRWSSRKLGAGWEMHQVRSH